MDDTNITPDTDQPAATKAIGGRFDLQLQNRNAIIYTSLIALTYLAAPVLYVDLLHTGMFKRLHTSDTLANLPSTVYLAMAWFPFIAAWLFPQARLLKPLMSFAYGLTALMGAVVAVVILVQPSREIIIGVLLVHAALVGCAIGLTGILNWEALHRGVSEQLRGKALGLAFGLGPTFAVAGSLGAQLLLNNKLFDLRLPQWMTLAYPYNYVFLFGVSVVCMSLAAFLVHLYRIPIPKVDNDRESFSVAVLGGFKSILSNRVLLIACMAYLLVYCGNMVQNNMSIFTKEAVGVEPDHLAGFQLALRFSFKILAGFLLGWLLTRTNPKVPLLVTVGLQMAGVIWVLMVPGYWFLMAFGLMGAGELFGVYYINYPVCCSPKSQIRRNIACLGLISSLVGLSPMLYGWISDTWNLRASFWTAFAILAFTTILVVVRLPANPKPRPEDLRESDLAGDE
jgi:hypothetical protein